ncbi:MAG TPA: PilZ domain-containing protein [Candidatus Dormibacteraeota bacterium]|nr:PilZ domain-containing protein [Candidatus Dormibacteraeota bacterium]
MADEIDAGASYLASLKQSRTPQAVGAAPARAPQISQPEEARPGGMVPGRTASGPADKRKSPRYKCTGSARLQEVGGTVATWATFADISMHGCYVETPSPLPLRAVLAMKLDANGFRVEASGEVRVVYPGLGMGISFANMSDEDRGRLRELVRSLSPTSVIVSSRTGPRPPQLHNPRLRLLRPTRRPRSRPCRSSSKIATSWAGKSFSGFCGKISSSSRFSVTLVSSVTPASAQRLP